MKKMILLLVAVAGISFLVFQPASLVGPARTEAADPSKALALVNVIELPRGQKELTGSSDFGGHALRLSAEGTILRWTDSGGNVQVAPVGSENPALEVLDPSNRNTRLFPAEKTQAEVKTVSPQVTHATVSRTDGVRLVCVVEAARGCSVLRGPLSPWPPSPAVG
jgi:hypothetical protein